MSVEQALWIYRGLIALMLVLGATMVWRCRRGEDDPRVGSGLFSLVAIGMLAVSPLVWTHYFIWTLPALVYLSKRPRWVLGWGLASAVMLTTVPTRAMGAHMLLSLVLYGRICHDLWGWSANGPDDAVGTSAQAPRAA